MSNREGGPAFPRLAAYIDCGGDDKEFYSAQEGMSLRDWFAGQALIGLLARTVSEDGMVMPWISTDDPWLGIRAYEAADRLLVERGRAK